MTAEENNAIAYNARIEQVQKLVDDASLQGYFFIEVSLDSLIQIQTEWLEKNGYSVENNENFTKIIWGKI
jgi:hypothetical protein